MLPLCFLFVLLLCSETLAADCHFNQRTVEVNIDLHSLILGALSGLLAAALVALLVSAIGNCRQQRQKKKLRELISRVFDSPNADVVFMQAPGYPAPTGPPPRYTPRSEDKTKVKSKKHTE
ncbi:hypothetical protein ACLKA7_010536 [Drosophila subpalustris]